MAKIDKMKGSTNSFTANEVGSLERRVQEARAKLDSIQTQITQIMGPNMNTSLPAIEKEAMVVVHGLWDERNSRIFNSKCRTTQELIHEMKTNLAIRVRNNIKLFDYISSL